jgi:predicted nucleotidyltransferase
VQVKVSLIDELVQRIVNAVHPLRIILFGSAARGEMGPNSDLDVLVVMPDGTHWRNTSRLIYERLYGLGFAKDIVVATVSDLEKYGNNPSLIYWPALREGKELYHAEE